MSAGSVRKMFGLHLLLLEDIANTDQRPKLDDWHLRLCGLEDAYEGQNEGDINVEQVSLVFRIFALSFQENGGDVFCGVKERLRNGRVRLRHAGADYLLYALMDSIVDRYFVILETLGRKIEMLQDVCDESRSGNAAGYPRAQTATPVLPTRFMLRDPHEQSRGPMGGVFAGLHQSLLP